MPETIVLPDVFVGLDLSLSSAGFCKLTGATHELKTFKTKPDSFTNDIERLIFISKEINDRIPDNVKLICIEDYFVPHNAAQIGSAIKLVQLGTVVRLQLYQRGLPFVTATAAQLKKFATGKGAGDKNLILREVFKRWGVECKDDNQNDGFVLAKMAEGLIPYLAGDRSLPAFQNEVIEKLIKERPKYNVDFSAKSA
jgi:crossover junction endodeoxyribonuclease RuvC